MGFIFWKKRLILCSLCLLYVWVLAITLTIIFSYLIHSAEVSLQEERSYYKAPSMKPHNMLKRKTIFDINPTHICGINGPYLLMLVHSKSNHFQERQLIRETWGSLQMYRNKTIKTVFLLGATKNKTEQRDILRESESKNDILQGDFIDDYRNMTYKNLMGLAWVSQYCPKTTFVFKVDDDIFVNIFKTIDYMIFSEKKGTSDNLNCRRMAGSEVHRNKEDRWYVSKEEFEYDFYPPFCIGMGYFTKLKTIQKLHLVAQTFDELLWVDDVFVTGIVAMKADVKHTPLKRPINGWEFLKEKYVSDKVNQFVILQAERSYDLYYQNIALWRQVWNASIEFAEDKKYSPEHIKMDRYGRMKFFPHFRPMRKI